MGPSAPARIPQGATRELEGRLELFGFPTGGARVTALPRSTSWRGIRASLFAGGGLLLAPIVGLFPPHVPWVLAALAIGGFFAFRRWRERYTLLALDGSCPRCGDPLELGGPTPFRPVISIPCPGCHHDSRLRILIP
jgi:hypothetical protein